MGCFNCQGRLTYAARKLAEFVMLPSSSQTTCTLCLKNSHMLVKALPLCTCACTHLCVHMHTFLPQSIFLFVQVKPPLKSNWVQTDKCVINFLVFSLKSAVMQQASVAVDKSETATFCPSTDAILVIAMLPPHSIQHI